MLTITKQNAILVLTTKKGMINVIKKICKQCGKEFTTDNNRKRLCDDCRTHNRKIHATVYIKQYSKEKRHHLSISEEDYSYLKLIAKVSHISIAKVIHLMIEEYKSS